MADQPRVQLRCDGCGQTDDHPKMHYGAQTYHHDCIPAFVLDDLTSETYYEVQGNQLVMTHRVPLPEEQMHPGTRLMMKVREKAQGGTRGPKLLEFIQKQDSVHELPNSVTYGGSGDPDELSSEEN